MACKAHFSPSANHCRDIYLIQKLVGLGENDGVQINVVVTQMFYLMGVWPGIYAALLLPSAKSGKKVRLQRPTGA